MFDPRDYDGETTEGNERERRELIAREQEQSEEREAVACMEADYYSALYPAQIEIAEPVAMAISGWRKAMAIARRAA